MNIPKKNAWFDLLFLLMLLAAIVAIMMIDHKCF